MSGNLLHSFESCHCLQVKLTYHDELGQIQTISRSCNDVALREQVYVWQALKLAVGVLPMFVPVTDVDSDKHPTPGGVAQVWTA